MSGLKQIIQEIHRRSLWQVLGIYLVGAAVGYQLIEALVDGLGLPDWFPPFAVVLFIIALPMVLATAFVQEGFRSTAHQDPTLLPAAEEARAQAGEGRTARGLFTWRNAIAGGVIAFALWGIAAAGWVVFGGGIGPATGDSADTSAEKLKTIAVLPFANMSDDPENAFFTAGIHEDILSQLAKIRDLTVISRTSVMQYAETEKPMREIAEELGAGSILEGSVRRADGTVRVVTQLIDAEADAHLWSETYDRDLTVANVFAIQSDIAGQIAGALKAQFSPEEKARIESTPTENLDAYDFYLRGNDYFVRPGGQLENFRSAQRMFEHAVELDPQFALAFARLSEVHSRMYWWSYDRTPERLVRAKEAGERAVEIQPHLPEAHLALGWHYYWGYLDYGRALQELAIAELGLPSNAELQAAKASIYRRQGRLEEAASGFKRAAALDPGNAIWWGEFAATLRSIRRYAEAERAYDRAMQLAPDVVDYAIRKAYIQIYRDGDMGPLRALLEQTPRDVDPRGLVTDSRFWLEFLDRNYPAALDVLAGSQFDRFDLQFRFTPKALLAGYLHSAVGEPSLARAAFDSARLMLEAELRERPDDPRLHSSLGVAYAGLGVREEAVREGRRATELYPMSKDLWSGPAYVLRLAYVYLMLGEHESALEQLDRYLATGRSYYINRLLLDPRIDPIRDDPRLQALIERYR